MTRLVLLFVLLSVPALGAAPAKTVGKSPAKAATKAPPILRIETHGHLAPIHHISVDKSGRWMLTTSADRTARIWDLQAKKPHPERTLRVQIGGGAEGSIFAGAMSPDGKTVVISAVTDNNSLYVIDRASGKILKYLPQLPETGLGLSYSRDGKRLAVTSRHGVLVFETAKWTVVFEDTYYGASFSADFDDAGRLVTTSYDGAVRIYDPQGKALFSAQPPFGKRPQEARFSPDGSLIAVGFADVSEVGLFSGKDMAYEQSPNLSGLAEGGFQAITWSRDGSQLVAAGTAQRESHQILQPKQTESSTQAPVGVMDRGSYFLVRAWQKSGRGTFTDFKPPVSDVILDIATLPNGSIVYASADASWGVISAKGELATEFSPASAQFQGMRLRLSPDGRSIRFAYRRGGHDLASFSVDELKLYPKPPQTTRWLAPDEKVDGESAPKPPDKKLPLPIGPREIVRASAHGNKDNFFVFGTDVALRCVDAKGNILWEGSVPGAVRAVNISSDDKLAVVAYADGTIRWHRAKDGFPLLTFFPHSDGKRWVAYTVSGYYADSVGADEFLRFVENSTPDKLPKESPVGAFAKRFHRPDVVSRILTTLDEGQALSEADEALKTAPKAKAKH